MKELTSRKNNQVHLVSDKEYEIIKANFWLKRYRVKDVKPIRPVDIIIAQPKKTLPEIKKPKSKSK